ncbi:MAG: sigma-70 family RNA polymerase sigma factor [Actinomycetota bacterium]|nr:sigma-70 family RNA polymerase sigma factor [Actinomycetota bacterium]
MKDLELKEYGSSEISRLKNMPVEELIGIYKRTKSPGLLKLIIDKTRKLAYKVASGFNSNGYDREEIEQTALTGLIISVNRFDTGSGNKFSTFAFHYMKGEIMHFIRDSRLVRGPRWLWKLNKIFTSFVRDYENKNNRYPTIEEISEGINIPVEGIHEFMKAREAVFYDNMEIDSDGGSYNNSKANGQSGYDRSLIKSKRYRSFDLVMEDKIFLWDAIDNLCSLNRKILILSYFMGFSQAEIGKRVGLSQKYVSRKLKQSIKDLKEYFA